VAQGSLLLLQPSHATCRCTLPMHPANAPFHLCHAVRPANTTQTVSAAPRDHLPAQARQPARGERGRPAPRAGGAWGGAAWGGWWGGWRVLRGALGECRRIRARAAVCTGSVVGGRSSGLFDGVRSPRFVAGLLPSNGSGMLSGDGAARIHADVIAQREVRGNTICQWGPATVTALRGSVQ